MNHSSSAAKMLERKATRFPHFAVYAPIFADTILPCKPIQYALLKKALL
jgi:hypothetical protein